MTNPAPAQPHPFIHAIIKNSKFTKPDVFITIFYYLTNETGGNGNQKKLKHCTVTQLEFLTL